MTAQIIAFPGYELPDTASYAADDHPTLEAKAALELSMLIMARNRHSIAPPDAAKARKTQRQIEAMREVCEPFEEFDRSHLLNLRVARNQLDWLLDRIERKHARAKARKA